MFVQICDANLLIDVRISHANMFDACQVGENLAYKSVNSNEP